MLAVCVLLALLIGALIGSIGYAFGVPLWQCVGIGSILLIVPCLYISYLIVLYKDSQKEGTPRKSITDYEVTTHQKTQMHESLFHPFIALLGGWMVGGMLMGGNSK